jgi:hypothetical protein
MLFCEAQKQSPLRDKKQRLTELTVMCKATGQGESQIASMWYQQTN